MLVYLSKKIAIPNQIKLNCISWNRDQGWIACGGESGLLKVLRLETPSGPEAMLQGIAASSNLSMNQTLEGHNGGVMCVTWNPIYRKLTTSDETGLIIVWMLHKGMWYEEMINNRNKSVVRDMKWTADGRKIAIVYEDGAVIVGAVDGHRLWGKDLPYPLRFVEWSPDGKLLLFVTFEAEVYIYDADGNKVRQFPLLGQDPNALGGDCLITSIHWYCPTNLSYSSSKTTTANGERLSATLCIAYENGKIQLSRGEDESTAELIDTDLSCVDYVRWSTRGQTLAVVGTQRSLSNLSSSMKTENVKNTNIVKFFDAQGKFIRNLKIPGENIREVSWEGGDLRLSLAVDAFIYFANIRHKYTWTYFLNTVVYAYARSERKDYSVVFWDLTTQEVYTKLISNVKFLLSGGDVCAVVVCERPSGATTSVVTKSSAKKQQQQEESKENTPNLNSHLTPNGELYTIQLRNSIGAVLDTKPIPFAPKFVAMSGYTIVVANDRTVYTWQYQSMSSRYGTNNGVEDTDTPEGSGRSKNTSNTASHGNKHRIFDIQNINFTYAQSPDTFTINTDTIIDPITAITISDKFLLVGRKNGQLHRFNLPHLTPENTYQLHDHEPVAMKFNCYSNKLSVIDANGLLNVLDLEFRVPESGGDQQRSGEGKDGDDYNPLPSKSTKGKGGMTSGYNAEHSAYLGPQFGKKLPIERKDVWDMCWAEDDPDMLVIMEKTKMIVFHGEVAEEPVVSAAYLGRVKDLEIRVVAMDTLMQHPDKISKEYIIDFESKVLRELREKIATVGLVNAYEFAEYQASHKRLWKLLGCVALEELEFTIAEKAFIRCEDYYSIMFVKQVMVMTDKMKARAEIAIYLHHFDEAESLYREIDRKDLAIALRKSLGDYPRVIQLLQTGGGNDKLMQTAYNSIADYYYDRRKWKKAIQYYLLSHNLEKLIHCYYYLEMFPELIKILHDCPDNSPYLLLLGQKFESVGMISEAMDCYLRSLQTISPKEAIDCCVKLNKWDQALELAEKHDYPQVESLLMKFMIDLLQKNKKLEAIELFRVANKPTEAAILIGDLAETVISELANPSLAKKLHVLAALEIERHRKRTIELAQQQDGTGAGALTAGGPTGGGNLAQATAATLETLMMTSLLEGGGTINPNTLGGTLQLTLNTLHQGTTTTLNAKKVSRAFANAWRGAAAYHYYMLALRQFYANAMDAAMKTTIKLCEYDDILSARIIYSLLCLTSLKNKFYGVCSKAFVKLETLPGLSEAEKDDIQALAVQIFTVNPPHDPAPLMDAYALALDVGRSFPACTITGRAIQDSPAYMCRTCRHYALEYEIENYEKHLYKYQQALLEQGRTQMTSLITIAPLQHCPLCHTPLAAKIALPGAGPTPGGGVGLGGASNRESNATGLMGLGIGGRKK